MRTLRTRRVAMTRDERLHARFGLQSRVLTLEQLAHVIDGGAVFLGECFDDLLMAGRIAGVVPKKNSHWFSSSNPGRMLTGAFRASQYSITDQQRPSCIQAPVRKLRQELACHICRQQRRAVTFAERRECASQEQSRRRSVLTAVSDCASASSLRNTGVFSARVVRADAPLSPNSAARCRGALAASRSDANRDAS